MAASARLRKILAAREAEEEAEKANAGYKFNSHGNINTNYGGVNNNTNYGYVNTNYGGVNNNTLDGAVNNNTNYGRVNNHKYGAAVMNNNGKFHGDGNGGVFYGGFSASKNYYI